MSSALLKKWTFDFPPEKMLAAENSSLSLINLKEARLILDGLKQSLEFQKIQNETLQANESKVFQHSIGIYQPQPQPVEIVTAEGPAIVMAPISIYAEIECYLNSYAIASPTNSAMKPEEHDTILQTIIELRQTFVIGQTINDAEDDYLSPIANLDHLSCQTELKKLAAKWHSECKAIFAPYQEKIEEWRQTDRTETEMNELDEAIMSSFAKQYESFNIEARATAATKTLETLFLNNQFVANFLECSLLEAEINNERFLPFFDLGKINYTASSSLIVHGICLGAHLADPTKIPRYIAFAEQIKGATPAPRQTSNIPNPP